MSPDGETPSQEAPRVLPAGLHWLGPEPQHDLCAHGGVVVLVDGEEFVRSEDADLAVSTAALHLLRTVVADHTPESPVGEHLVPHCGHFMVVDGETGLVANVGCPWGENWWVRHVDGVVVLTRGDGAERRVGRGAWAGAVADFADAVEAFHAASPPREFSDDYDAGWFAVMREEWTRLRAAAADLCRAPDPPRP